MAVELPQVRLPKSAVPKLVDYGATLTAVQGGASQRLNRLGNRFALTIVYPRLRPEPDGRILAQRVRQAVTEGALFAVPQPGVDLGMPGNPVVNGGGQAGAMLEIRGFVPGYTVREGQFFSILHGGRRYLHTAGAEVIADGSGWARLAVTPMLRISPANGAICEFAKPYIEGFIDGRTAASIEHTIAKAMVPEITITEAK